MRFSLIAIAGLLLAASLPGCGASTTIPAPPTSGTPGPPPGTSPEMAKVPKSNNPDSLMQGSIPATTPKATPRK